MVRVLGMLMVRVLGMAGNGEESRRRAGGEQKESRRRAGLIFMPIPGPGLMGNKRFEAF